MARLLIVGAGCHGRELGARMAASGWRVRGTTRGREHLAAIEAAGIEPALADPDRPAEALELVADVSVILYLLGSLDGPAAAIHGPRLERLLEKLVDTPVRGFLYEATGSVASEILAGGCGLIAEASARTRIPTAALSVPRAAPDWLGRAEAALLSLLG